MLFPISDDDRDLKGFAPVTIGLILINLAVFFLLQETGENQMFTYGWSVIPYEIVNGIDLVAPEAVNIGGQREVIPQAPGPTPIYLTIISAMFMHGGYMHLFGNLLYLWIFGDNVEMRFGSVAFLGFYLVSGVVATFAQVFSRPFRYHSQSRCFGCYFRCVGGVYGAISEESSTRDFLMDYCIHSRCYRHWCLDLDAACERVGVPGCSWRICWRCRLCGPYWWVCRRHRSRPGDAWGHQRGTARSI